MEFPQSQKLALRLLLITLVFGALAVKYAHHHVLPPTMVYTPRLDVNTFKQALALDHYKIDDIKKVWSVHTSMDWLSEYDIQSLIIRKQPYLIPMEHDLSCTDLLKLFTVNPETLSQEIIDMRRGMDSGTYELRVTRRDDTYQEILTVMHVDNEFHMSHNVLTWISALMTGLLVVWIAEIAYFLFDLEITLNFLINEMRHELTVGTFVGTLFALLCLVTVIIIVKFVPGAEAAIPLGTNQLSFSDMSETKQWLYIGATSVLSALFITWVDVLTILVSVAMMGVFWYTKPTWIFGRPGALYDWIHYSVRPWTWDWTGAPDPSIKGHIEQLKDRCRTLIFESNVFYRPTNQAENAYQYGMNMIQRLRLSKPNKRIELGSGRNYLVTTCLVRLFNQARQDLNFVRAEKEKENDYVSWRDSGSLKWVEWRGFNIPLTETTEHWFEQHREEWARIDFVAPSHGTWTNKTILDEYEAAQLTQLMKTYPEFEENVSRETILGPSEEVKNELEDSMESGLNGTEQHLNFYRISLLYLLRNYRDSKTTPITHHRRTPVRMTWFWAIFVTCLMILCIPRTILCEEMKEPTFVWKAPSNLFTVELKTTDPIQWEFLKFVTYDFNGKTVLGEYVRGAMVPQFIERIENPDRYASYRMYLARDVRGSLAQRMKFIKQLTGPDVVQTIDFEADLLAPELRTLLIKKKAIDVLDTLRGVGKKTLMDSIDEIVNRANVAVFERRNLLVRDLPHLRRDIRSLSARDLAKRLCYGQDLLASYTYIPRAIGLHRVAEWVENVASDHLLLEAVKNCEQDNTLEHCAAWIEKNQKEIVRQNWKLFGIAYLPTMARGLIILTLTFLAFLSPFIFMYVSLLLCFQVIYWLILNLAILILKLGLGWPYYIPKWIHQFYKYVRQYNKKTDTGVTEKSTSSDATLDSNNMSLLTTMRDRDSKEFWTLFFFPVLIPFWAVIQCSNWHLISDLALIRSIARITNKRLYKWIFHRHPLTVFFISMSGYLIWGTLDASPMDLWTTWLTNYSLPIPEWLALPDFKWIDIQWLLRYTAEWDVNGIGYATWLILLPVVQTLKLVQWGFLWIFMTFLSSSLLVTSYGMVITGILALYPVTLACHLLMTSSLSLIPIVYSSGLILFQLLIWSILWKLFGLDVTGEGSQLEEITYSEDGSMVLHVKLPSLPDEIFKIKVPIQVQSLKFKKGAEAELSAPVTTLFQEQQFDSIEMLVKAINELKMNMKKGKKVSVRMEYKPKRTKYSARFLVLLLITLILLPTVLGPVFIRMTAEDTVDFALWGPGMEGMQKQLMHHTTGKPLDPAPFPVECDINYTDEGRKVDCSAIFNRITLHNLSKIFEEYEYRTMFGEYHIRPGTWRFHDEFISQSLPTEETDHYSSTDEAIKNDMVRLYLEYKVTLLHGSRAKIFEQYKFSLLSFMTAYLITLAVYMIRRKRVLLAHSMDEELDFMRACKRVQAQSSLDNGKKAMSTFSSIPPDHLPPSMRLLVAVWKVNGKTELMQTGALRMTQQNQLTRCFIPDHAGLTVKHAENAVKKFGKIGDFFRMHLVNARVIHSCNECKDNWKVDGFCAQHCLEIKTSQIHRMYDDVDVLCFDKQQNALLMKKPSVNESWKAAIVGRPETGQYGVQYGSIGEMVPQKSEGKIVEISQTRVAYDASCQSGFCAFPFMVGKKCVSLHSISTTGDAWNNSGYRLDFLKKLLEKRWAPGFVIKKLGEKEEFDNLYDRLVAERLEDLEKEYSKLDASTVEIHPFTTQMAKYCKCDTPCTVDESCLFGAPTDEKANLVYQWWVAIAGEERDDLGFHDHCMRKGLEYTCENYQSYLFLMRDLLRYCIRENLNKKVLMIGTETSVKNFPFFRDIKVSFSKRGPVRIMRGPVVVRCYNTMWSTGKDAKRGNLDTVAFSEQNDEYMSVFQMEDLAGGDSVYFDEDMNGVTDRDFITSGRARRRQRRGAMDASPAKVSEGFSFTKGKYHLGQVATSDAVSEYVKHLYIDFGWTSRPFHDHGSGMGALAGRICGLISETLLPHCVGFEMDQTLGVKHAVPNTNGTVQQKTRDIRTVVEQGSWENSGYELVNPVYVGNPPYPASLRGSTTYIHNVFKRYSSGAMILPASTFVMLDVFTGAYMGGHKHLGISKMFAIDIPNIAPHHVQETKKIEVMVVVWDNEIESKVEKTKYDLNLVDLKNFDVEWFGTESYLDAEESILEDTEAPLAEVTLETLALQQREMMKLLQILTQHIMKPTLAADIQEVEPITEESIKNISNDVRGLIRACETISTPLATESARQGCRIIGCKNAATRDHRCEDHLSSKYVTCITCANSYIPLSDDQECPLCSMAVKKELPVVSHVAREKGQTVFQMDAEKIKYSVIGYETADEFRMVRVPASLQEETVKPTLDNKNLQLPMTQHDNVRPNFTIVRDNVIATVLKQNEPLFQDVMKKVPSWTMTPLSQTENELKFRITFDSVVKFLEADKRWIHGKNYVKLDGQEKLQICPTTEMSCMKCDNTFEVTDGADPNFCPACTLKVANTNSLDAAPWTLQEKSDVGKNIECERRRLFYVYHMMYTPGLCAYCADKGHNSTNCALRKAKGVLQPYCPYCDMVGNQTRNCKGATMTVMETAENSKCLGAKKIRDTPFAVLWALRVQRNYGVQSLATWPALVQSPPPQNICELAKNTKFSVGMKQGLCCRYESLAHGGCVDCMQPYFMLQLGDTDEFRSVIAPQDENTRKWLQEAIGLDDENVGVVQIMDLCNAISLKDKEFSFDEVLKHFPASLKRYRMNSRATQYGPTRSFAETASPRPSANKWIKNRTSRLRSDLDSSRAHLSCMTDSTTSESEFELLSATLNPSHKYPTVEKASTLDSEVSDFVEQNIFPHFTEDFQQLTGGISPIAASAPIRQEKMADPSASNGQETVKDERPRCTCGQFRPKNQEKCKACQPKPICDCGRVRHAHEEKCTRCLEKNICECGKPKKAKETFCGPCTKSNKTPTCLCGQPRVTNGTMCVKCRPKCFCGNKKKEEDELCHDCVELRTCDCGKTKKMNQQCCTDCHKKNTQSSGNTKKSPKNTSVTSGTTSLDTSVETGRGRTHKRSQSSGKKPKSQGNSRRNSPDRIKRTNSDESLHTMQELMKVALDSIRDEYVLQPKPHSPIRRNSVDLSGKEKTTGGFAPVLEELKIKQADMKSAAKELLDPKAPTFAPSHPLTAKQGGLDKHF